MCSVSSVIGILFAFLASLFKSGSELTTKFLINNELNEYVASFAYRFFALPVLTILVYIFGIPEVSTRFWYALLLATPLNILATILYMKALKHSDISIVSPIKAMAPMALLITSPIMIGEYASPVGIIGVVLITFGVYSLKISEFSKETLLRPFKKVLEEKGARYAFLVMIIYSITSNIDKIGVENSSAIFWTFASHIVISIGLGIIMYKQVDNPYNTISNNWKGLLPIGTFSGLGVAAQMTALSYTLVVYVIAIKRTALLWNIFGGTLLLGEKDLKERAFGGFFIICGVIIISLSL